MFALKRNMRSNEGFIVFEKYKSGPLSLNCHIGITKIEKNMYIYVYIYPAY